MATDHISYEEALDQALVYLVRLAALAAVQPGLQLSVCVLQALHWDNTEGKKGSETRVLKGISYYNSIIDLSQKINV